MFNKTNEKSPSQGKVEIAMVVTDEENQQTKLFRADQTCIRGIGDYYLLIGIIISMDIEIIITFEGQRIMRMRMIKMEAEGISLSYIIYIQYSNTFVLDKSTWRFSIVIDSMNKVIDNMLFVWAFIHSIKKLYHCCYSNLVLCFIAHNTKSFTQNEICS